jgi:sensor histidine kinase YesM
LYWGVQGWATSDVFKPGLGILQFITDVVMYIFITHLYRNFVLRNHWQDLPLNLLVKRIVPAVLFMGLVYTVVTVLKLYAIRIIFITGSRQGLLEFFQLNGLPIFMAGLRLMSIWLLAYHLYQYAQREIRLVKENARLGLNFKEAQLDNLSAQLNPHFLFNSLNTIKSLITTKPQSARRGIDLLSELLRSGLYKEQSMFIAVREEMDLVKDYLELEQLRMEERLTHEIVIDEMLLGVPIPRMSIQTLVENAVKHGISRQKEGGLISINIFKQDEFLCICIRNPGLLDLTGSTSGIGIKNLRERLQIAYQGKANFEMSLNVDGMVCSTLNIPLL